VIITLVFKKSVNIFLSKIGQNRRNFVVIITLTPGRFYEPRRIVVGQVVGLVSHVAEDEAAAADRTAQSHAGDRWDDISDLG
jgi:hypothetical protein